MKLMYVITQSELGGAQSVVANLSNYFASIKGNEVYIVSGGPGDAWKFLHPDIKVIYIKESQKKISWKDLIVLIKLFLIRFKYKPDKVHLHSSKAGILGRIAFSKKKVIYTVHGFDSIRVAFRRFLLFEKLLKNRANQIVGVSNYDAENLEKEGIKGSVCIYNGIEDFANPARKFNTTDIQNVIDFFDSLKKEGKFIVCSIARLSKQKRYSLFCEVADIFKENKEIVFVWIGNQMTPDYVPENAYCLGEVAEAHRVLPYTDLFFLPSNYEGLPVSIIEALCYGKPIVASDTGGVNELLDGNNGHAIVNEANLFAEKISLYKNDKLLYEDACKAARTSYLEKFTLDTMCEQYKRILEKGVSQ